jgi:RNA polymerase sigma-70 factor (ECF subfamily)
MDTDDALLARLAVDLDHAFETLVRENEDRIFTIALRFLGDRDDAEDAAQETFVRAYRALQSYTAQRIASIRLRPWLATIVLNICRNRSRGRVRTAPGAPAESESSTPHDIVVARESRERWARLLAALPSAHRAALILRHVDGLTYPEIAVALGRPEGTVKAQVHRGLALLRAAYDAEERSAREELTA